MRRKKVKKENEVQKREKEKRGKVKLKKYI